MGTGGFFNHYDDPDEFWDEAPLEPISGTAPARTSPSDARPSTARPEQRDVAPYRAAPAPEPNPVPYSPTSAQHSGFGERSASPGPSGTTRSIENLIDDLTRGSSYVQAISDMLRRAHDNAPSRFTGRDGSGAIEIAIDNDGVLVDLIVSEQWSRKVDGSVLGSAVLTAFREAEDRRSAAIVTALTDRRAVHFLREQTVDSYPSRVAEQSPRPTGPISSDALGEYAIRELEQPVTHDLPSSIGHGSGVDIQARLTLDARGVSDCEIRLAWGRSTPGAEIARALRDAYADARRSGAGRSDPNVPSISVLIESALGELSTMQNETAGGAR